MKKALVTLLVVLLAATAVFAAGFEIKVGQGFLKANAYVPGYQVTSATVSADFNRFEVGVTGSTTFPYAFFSNAFAKDVSWNTKWSNICDKAANYWTVSAYGTFDLVPARQIDLNVGASATYRDSKEPSGGAPSKAIALASKAEVTFWVADRFGVFAGVDFPLMEFVNNDGKWTSEFAKTLDGWKLYADYAATAAKAGLTVRL